MLSFIKKLFGSNMNNDLEQLIKDGAFLVDVRTPSEFAEQHAKGSVNIPLDKLAQSLGKFKDKKHIIVFCRSGMRSGQAKTILNQNGFSNVTNAGPWQNVGNIVHSL